jgi:hypothetical protein
MGADQSSPARFQTSASNGDFVDDNDRPPTFSQIPSFTPPAKVVASSSTANLDPSQSALAPTISKQTELHVDLAPSQMNVCNGRTPFVLALDLVRFIHRFPFEFYVYVMFFY